VGVESLNEVVDMEFEGAHPLEVLESLNHVLPRESRSPGCEAPLSAPSSQVERSIYWILLDHLLPRGEVIANIKNLWRSGRSWFIRNEKGSSERLMFVP